MKSKGIGGVYMSMKMLTNRQIDIIAGLLFRTGWVTSEQVSEYFNLNKKTIQIEIKNISEAMGKECVIVSSYHKGYCLEYISEEAKRYIYQEVMNHGGRTSLGIRPSSFVLYLLFLKSYISMQKLADTFYMSKTAVALEIKTVKRWVERYDGLKLEVSNQKGIMLHAGEARKRVYCAKFGSVHAFQSMPIADEIVKEYENYMIKTKEILLSFCTRFDCTITGEEFRKNARFIAINILRSRMGYSCEDTLQHYEESPEIQWLALQIKDEIHYELLHTELGAIRIMLEESSRLSMDSDLDWGMDTKLCALEERIGGILDIPHNSLFTKREMVLHHISKMKRRFQAGNVAVNHYNEDIVLRYPLEVHLIYRLIPECLGMKITKEYSFLALFLASGLNVYRDSVSVLLVSNQNMSIISQIEEVIRQIAMFHVRQFKVVPGYLFQAQPSVCQDYEILLTTDKEEMFLDYPFFLINCILMRKDMAGLNSYLFKKQEELRQKKRIDIKNKYLTEESIDCGKAGTCTLEQILGKDVDDSYSLHTFGNENLYIGRVCPLTETGIRVYSMPRPVHFLNKKIGRVILAQFKEGEAGIFDFFDVVSDILYEFK